MDTPLRTGSETTDKVDVSLMPQREPLRTWAGHGTGAVCNGCGEPIQAHEIEYEVEMAPGSDVPALNFHLPCYRTWTGR